MEETVVGDLDKFIAEISKHIGYEWKFLARSLGFGQTDIDAIEYKDVHNLKEQIFQMFHEWKRREGTGATTEHLLAAIKHADLHELLKTLRENGFVVSSLRGSANFAGSLATGVRYPVQATDDAQRDHPAKLKIADDAQRDSPAKLKTAAKSPPAPAPGAQGGQAQGGTTPPSERDLIRQKRLQRLAPDTSDRSGSNLAQHDVVERTTSTGSVQSPLLSPNVAATNSTANIPTLDSRPSGLGFEVGDMIQVDRPDSAPWYGVVQWIGTLPGSNCLSAGIEMDNKVQGGGPGSFQGVNYFNCLDGHGLFLPMSRLKRDGRFAEVDVNTSEAPTSSSNQGSEPSQPSRSASAPEDGLRNIFLELQKLGMQDDTSAKQPLAPAPTLAPAPAPAPVDDGPKVFELQIPADRAGLVIGTGGKNIREVERLTNTTIKVDGGLGLLGGQNSRVIVVGSEENCKKALLIILKHVKRRVDEHTAGVKTISVPESSVGRIIGKGGATISTIKSISGAQDIKFDDKKTGFEALLQTKRTCYIHGSEEAIEKAEKLIRLAMTGENIVAGATFAAIFMELLKMGVQCQEEERS